ncbi:TetR/AcrR family transcriptional regulator [Puia sp. P3]|uniref:TetR/AcrR family transcriptional regulator n=1 Tax=Puia sp. P3 TaxID=3423952 RepID=UPI003D675AA1
MQRTEKQKVALSSETEEKLMKAAQNAFIKYGLEGARMQEIADEAGISKSMLHYYFAKKEKLFELIMRKAVLDVFANLRKILEENDSVMSKIHRLSREYLDYLHEHPYLPLFVLHESHKDPAAFKNDFLPPAETAFTTRFVAQIEEEIKIGKIRPVDPYVLFAQIMSVCVFPVAAQPVLQGIMNLSADQYKMLLKQTQQQMPAFFERILNW